MKRDFQYWLAAGPPAAGDYSAVGGPPFLLVEWGTIEAPDVQTARERLFARHNEDERPYGRAVRSMSVGDVLVIDGYAYRVEPFGFHDHTWTEAERPSTVARAKSLAPEVDL